MKTKLTALAAVAPLTLSACGAAATVQQGQPTPTPLPQAPALERPTHTVQRGAVERALDANGRIIPIDDCRVSVFVPLLVTQTATTRRRLRSLIPTPKENAGYPRRPELSDWLRPRQH